MSVKPEGAYYIRSTSIPGGDPVSAVTIMGWIFPRGAGYSNLGSVGPAAGGVGFGWDNTTPKFFAYNGLTAPVGSVVTLDTWYHLALVVSGTGTGAIKLYVNAVLDITMDGNSGLTPNDKLWIGNSGGGSAFGDASRLCALKFWGAALTITEVAAEMNFAYPVRTANINGAYLLQSDTLTDVSGQGHDLTRVGSGITTSTDPGGVDFNPISGGGFVPKSRRSILVPGMRTGSRGLKKE